MRYRYYLVCWTVRYDNRDARSGADGVVVRESNDLAELITYGKQQVEIANAEVTDDPDYYTIEDRVHNKNVWHS